MNVLEIVTSWFSLHFAPYTLHFATVLEAKVYFAHFLLYSDLKQTALSLLLLIPTQGFKFWR